MVFNGIYIARIIKNSDPGDSFVNFVLFTTINLLAQRIIFISTYHGSRTNHSIVQFYAIRLQSSWHSISTLHSISYHFASVLQLTQPLRQMKRVIPHRIRYIHIRLTFRSFSNLWPSQPPPVIPDSGGLYTANVGQPGVYPEQLESRLCSICCAPISESGTCVSQHCLGIDQPVFGIGNLAVLPAPSDVDSGSELCSAAPLQYPVLNYSHRRLRSGHKLTRYDMFRSLSQISIDNPCAARCTTCHTNPPDTKFKTCANCRKNACKRQRDHRSKSKGPRSTKDRAIIPLEDSHVSHGLEDSGMTWKNMHRRGAGATDRSGARVELLAWAEPIIAGVQVLEDHAQPIMTDTQVELQESEINLSFYTRTAANSDTSLSSLAGQVLGSAFDINPSQSERYAARNKVCVLDFAPTLLSSCRNEFIYCSGSLSYLFD